MDALVWLKDIFQFDLGWAHPPTGWRAWGREWWCGCQWGGWHGWWWRWWCRPTNDGKIRSIANWIIDCCLKINHYDYNWVSALCVVNTPFRQIDSVVERFYVNLWFCDLDDSIKIFNWIVWFDESFLSLSSNLVSDNFSFDDCRNDWLRNDATGGNFRSTFSENPKPHFPRLTVIYLHEIIPNNSISSSTTISFPFSHSIGRVASKSIRLETKKNANQLCRKEIRNENMLGKNQTEILGTCK